MPNPLDDNWDAEYNSYQEEQLNEHLNGLVCYCNTPSVTEDEPNYCTKCKKEIKNDNNRTR